MLSSSLLLSLRGGVTFDVGDWALKIIERFECTLSVPSKPFFLFRDDNIFGDEQSKSPTFASVGMVSLSLFCFFVQILSFSAVNIFLSDYKISSKSWRWILDS